MSELGSKRSPKEMPHQRLNIASLRPSSPGLHKREQDGAAAYHGNKQIKMHCIRDAVIYVDSCPPPLMGPCWSHITTLFETEKMNFEHKEGVGILLNMRFIFGLITQPFTVENRRSYEGVRNYKFGMRGDPGQCCHM